jgi:ribosome-associated protein
LTKAKATKAAKIDPMDRVVKAVQTALEDLKAKDIMTFDVRGRTSITDMMVIASGTSTRHVKSIADNVQKFAKEAGFAPIGVEGARESEWVLVDLGYVIVHVMLPRTRVLYNLERLWGASPMNADLDQEIEATA